MIALNAAPRMNAIDRPNLIEKSLWLANSGTGRAKNRTTVRIAMKTATVRNWRFRYAFAPIWMDRAISFIFSEPSGAAKTSRTR